MNKAEKIQLINSTLDNLKEDILKKVDQMPDDWNGFEIKQLILDYYQENYYDSSLMKGERKQEYKDFCYQRSFI